MFSISFYMLISILTLLTLTKNMTNGNRYAIFIKNLPEESENLKKVLNYVRSKQEYSYSSIISIVFIDVRSNFVDFVSENIVSESTVTYKVTIDNLSQNYIWQNRIDLMWIIIIDDINVLNFLLDKQSHIWKATNQYLIIITAQTQTMLPQEIFYNVWINYSVYKIVSTSIQENFQCLNGYLPFEKNKSSKYGVIRKIHLTDQQNRMELYDKFEKLNGYPVRVVVFPSLMMNISFDKNTRKPKFNRLDADVILLLQKAMGTKFCIKIINELDKEDPFHRALQHIESGKWEMIITSFFIHEYKEYRKYEFTTSIYEDKLCLIAPTSGFVPKFYMPILPFTSDLWTALAVYNLLISVLWFFIKYYSETFHKQKVVLLPLMKTTRFTFSQRRNSFPKIHPYVSSCFHLTETLCYPLRETGGSIVSATSQRALLFGTLFFGLIVTGLYQSCLVSNLSEPLRYPELNTLEDVANSNFTIITKYDNLKENTFTDNTTLANRLKNKIEIFISDKPTKDMVAFTKNVIALGRYASLKLENLSNYYDEDGNELLHIVEECPITYLLSYIVRLYSPYRERINGLLLRMREAGLVELWYKNMTYPTYVDEQRRKIAKRGNKIKLTLEHYFLTFLGLSFGLFFSAITFFAELYFIKNIDCRRKEHTKILSSIMKKLHYSALPRAH